ncbi:MAG: DUF3793 family protein [Bacteroides sp.]|nr:DUF3793 family protein [Bacteroides sp.]MCM1549240.1 DUF3793 family protein [Clostridium sp.]
MPIQEITEYLASVDLLGQVEMLLALHCAPIISGIKISNLVVLTREQSMVLCRNIRSSGLAVWFLNYGEASNPVLIFRRNEMQQFLLQSDIEGALRQFGYSDVRLIPVLLQLSAHMREYKDGEREFPHELGILLGYPLEDVLGFMENDGENYTYCGYWKVYGDIEEAKRVFHTYNEVRNLAVTQVLNGSGVMRRGDNG